MRRDDTHAYVVLTLMLAVVTVLTVLMSCAPMEKTSWLSDNRRGTGDSPTLLVTNLTGSHLTILINGRREATVVRQEACLELKNLGPGPHQISYRVVAQGQTDTPFPVNLWESDGWKVTQDWDNRLERGSFTLQPAERCEPQS